MNATEKDTHILIRTDLGEIELKLYNETSLHRDNILKLIEKDFYRDQKFHRVIKDFMIQGGECASSDSADYGYKIPAEIVYPQYYHKRGALAAARLSDNMNPRKESSSTQFYIVTGTILRDSDLDMMEKRRFEKLKQSIFTELNEKNKDQVKELYRSGEKEKLADLRNLLAIEAEKLSEQRKNEALFTEAQRETYKSEGGSPHLDGDYSVFGEVVRGIEVLDKIQQIETNQKDQPIKDIKFKVGIISF